MKGNEARSGNNRAKRGNMGIKGGRNSSPSFSQPLLFPFPHSYRHKTRAKWGNGNNNMADGWIPVPTFLFGLKPTF
jgi:hypothetical protein